MSNDLSSVSLSRETLKGTVAKFVMAVVGFGGTILFGRLLGPASFGTYYELLSVSQVGARPLAGWGGAAKKRFSEAGNRTREIVGANYIGTVVWILFALTLVTIFSSSITRYAGIKSAALLVGLLLAPLAAFESLNVLVTGTGRVSATKWIDALRSIFTFCGQLALVSFGFGVLGMVLGFSVATLLTIPFLMWVLRIRPSIPSHDTVGSMWEYAKYSIPTGVVGMTYEQFDILLLGVLFTSEVTGHYKAVAVLTLPGFFVSEVASDGLMAKVSNAHSRGQEISENISNVLSFASIVSLPVLFGGIGLLDPLVTTAFGGDYGDATRFFLPLAVSRVIGTQIFPMYQAIEGINRPDVSFRIGSVALLTNIILGVALGLYIGPLGVVYATVAAELLQYVSYRWILTQNTTGVKFIARPFVEQLVAAVMMFAVVRGVRTVVPITTWWILLSIIAVGALVYFGCLSVISQQFRKTVREAMIKPSS